jgi:metacaspase-1
MPTGISLHIGLNFVDPKHYDGWDGELKACEADAGDMEAIASKQGYSSTLLLTKDATRKRVLDEIKAATGKLNGGDIFFLSYSGHGGQIPDTAGDEDDNWDETWCLYDAELLDDELYGAFSAFRPDIRILMLSDSCHSGTVAKEAFVFGTGIQAAQPRRMPRDIAMSTYLKNSDFYDDLQQKAPKDAEENVAATVLLISGCQDNQLSSDGEHNGLFTATLLGVWKNGAFTGHYRSFHSRILALMPFSQSPNYYVVGAPNPAFEKQKPFAI